MKSKSQETQSSETNDSLQKVIILLTLLYPVFVAGLDALAASTDDGDFKAGKDL